MWFNLTVVVTAYVMQAYRCTHTYTVCCCCCLVAKLCLTLLQEGGNPLKEIGVLFPVVGYKDAG